VQGRRGSLLELKGYPVVGHVPAFLLDKLAFLERCAADSPGVVKIAVGGPTFLLTEPEDIGHVLLAAHRRYIKTPRVASPRGRKLFGRGVLTSTGDRHLSLRRAVQPAFNPRTLERFAAAVSTTADETLDRWQPGEPVEVFGEGMRLARRAMLRTLFGVDAPEAERLDHDVRTRQQWIHYLFRSLAPYPEVVPRPITFRHLRARRRIDAALLAALRRPPDDASLLAFLSSRTRAGGEPLDEHELLDEARVFLVTGHETIGAGLAWTWYLLASHPDVQARVRAEVDEVLAGEPAGAGAVARLPHVSRVLSESFRLYPPTWIIVRVAVEPDVLPSGVPIPAGSKLYLCPWIVQRDRRWFPDPDSFDPERFSRDGLERLPEYAYFPFGGGTRLCIGKRFALMECAIAVARTAQRYELDLVPGQQIRPDPGIILAPRPGIRLVPRLR
jgi:cytochrome P450